MGAGAALTLPPLLAVSAVVIDAAVVAWRESVSALLSGSHGKVEHCTEVKAVGFVVMLCHNYCGKPEDDNHCVDVYLYGVLELVAVVLSLCQVRHCSTP